MSDCTYTHDDIISLGYKEFTNKFGQVMKKSTFYAKKKQLSKTDLSKAENNSEKLSECSVNNSFIQDPVIDDKEKIKLPNHVLKNNGLTDKARYGLLVKISQLIECFPVKFENLTKSTKEKFIPYLYTLTNDELNNLYENLKFECCNRNKDINEIIETVTKIISMLEQVLKLKVGVDVTGFSDDIKNDQELLGTIKLYLCEVQIDQYISNERKIMFGLLKHLLVKYKLNQTINTIKQNNPNFNFDMSKLKSMFSRTPIQQKIITETKQEETKNNQE